MAKKSLAVLVVLVVAGLVGCGGNGLPTPPPGGAFIEQVGDQTRVRGQVAFTDQAGNPVDPPAGAAVVVIGGESLAAGTDSLGRFLILGFLPLLQGLMVRVGAEGFLPCYTTIPPGATSLEEGTLALVEDTNLADNPTITLEDPPTMIGLDGVLRLGGSIPQATDVVSFWSAGSDLDSFAGAEGATLDTEYFEGTPGNRFFRSTLPWGLSTGRVFVAGFDPTTGFATSGIFLAIQPGLPPGYNRPVPPGNQISVSVPSEALGFSVTVSVVDAGNPSNFFIDNTTTGGILPGDLPQGPPVGNPPVVLVTFTWTDENGKAHSETYFGN